MVVELSIAKRSRAGCRLPLGGVAGRSSGGFVVGVGRGIKLVNYDTKEPL